LKDASLEPAPLHSDIEWDNFFKHGFARKVKTWILNLIVFLIAILIVSPPFFLDFLNKSGVKGLIEHIQVAHDNQITQLAY
jgi:uncharacterized membrane protein YwzB